MALFRKKPSMSVHPAEAPESWSVYEGDRNGKPLLARFNTGLQGAAGHPDYGIQVGVAVPFNDANTDGLPTPEEQAHLAEIEERIIALSGGNAVLSGVITTSGMREFVLYTGSGDWIEEFHHRLEAATPTHEVQVMAQTDPKWSIYRQFVE